MPNYMSAQTVDSTTVEAALVTAPGTVQLRAFEQIAPRPLQVAVDVHLCGVCVTEVKAFRDGSGHGPSLCGHEWVGRVAATGSDVRTVQVGDRVVVAVPEPCGACTACAGDRPQFCSFVMSVARGHDDMAPSHGGFARSLTVAEYRVLPVPVALSDVEAALVEPAAVAVHGVARSGLAPGHSAVVLGAGPIGLLTLQVARAAGASPAVVVEPTPTRREAALALGADAAVADVEEALDALADLAGERGADVVLECVGTSAAVQQAVDLARPGGRVTLIGDAASATVAPRLWLAKEVTVAASAGYSRRDIEEAMELMADGRVRAEPLRTRTIALRELAATLQGFVDGNTDDIKVMVDPRS